MTECSQGMTGSALPSFETLDDVLEHFGVKGMKWGVRKKDSSSRGESRPGANKDVVVKKGTELQNISGGGARSLEDHVFTSHTPKDNAFYAGNYAQTLAMFNTGGAYRNTFTAAKTIKAPGEKKRIDTFQKMYEDDPRTMARALATAKVDTSVGLSLARKLGVKVVDRQTEKFSGLGRDALRTEEMQRAFAHTLNLNGPTRRAYFDRLIREGYNATVDDNDFLSGADAPLLIFNASRTLTNQRSIPISQAEMDVAAEEFRRLQS